MWGWGYGNAGSWFGWMGPLFMVLFWAALVAGIVLSIRFLVLRARSGAGEDSAIELLGKRYARGEITKEQFEEMRHDLI